MRTEARIALLSVAIVGAVLPVMLACSSDLRCGTGTRVYNCTCCHGPGCVGLPGKRKEKKLDVCASQIEHAEAEADFVVNFGSTDQSSCSCWPEPTEFRLWFPDSGDSGDTGAP